MRKIIEDANLSGQRLDVRSLHVFMAPGLSFLGGRTGLGDFQGCGMAFRRGHHFYSS